MGDKNLQFKNILLVEDDAFLRQLYEETLKDAGFRASSAIDGDEAFQKMHTGGWDLVLLDIMLPKRDGLTIMRQLQQDKTTHQNKQVIFLSNLDTDEQKKEALTLGDGYLVKSDLTPETFLAEVKKHLQKVTSIDS